MIVMEINRNIEKQSVGGKGERDETKGKGKSRGNENFNADRSHG